MHSCLLRILVVLSAIVSTTARFAGTGCFFRPPFVAVIRRGHKHASIDEMKQETLVSPKRLLECIDFNESSNNTLWDVCLKQRLLSSVASEGVWYADKITNDVSSVLDMEIVKPGRARIRLFCRDPSDDETVKNAVMLAHDAVKLAFDDTTQDHPRDVAVVTFAALDRRLLQKIGDSLRDNYTLKSSWDYPCGLWIREADTTLHESEILPENTILRPLTAGDAKLVESRWEYRSEDSLSMIQQMIADSQTTFGGCCGMEMNGMLVAWVCRYLDGTIGMLWTEEGHRRKGYGAHVVTAAANSIIQRRNEQATEATSDNFSPLIAFTVDTNSASRGLLTKLGWNRVGDADWAGFTLVKSGG